MMEPAGTKIPNFEPQDIRLYSCGAYLPGYLVGNHSSTPGETIDMKVCFFYTSNDNCYWDQAIQVKNCGDYYLYYLENTVYGGNAAAGRYCAE